MSFGEELISAIVEGDIEKVRFLLDQKGDLVATRFLLDEEIWYSLFPKVEVPLTCAVESGSTEVVRLLLERGAKLNGLHITRDNTPLAYAVEFGSTEMVELLLQYGACLNHPSHEGNILMLNAAKAGNIEMVKLLLEGKTKLNHSDHEGNNPLMYAVQAENTKMAKLLLTCDADPNQALDYASQKENVEMIDLLIQYGALITDTELPFYKENMKFVFLSSLHNPDHSYGSTELKKSGKCLPFVVIPVLDTAFLPTKT